MHYLKFICKSNPFTKLLLHLSQYKNHSFQIFSPALQHRRNESNSLEKNKNIEENWCKKADKSGIEDSPYPAKDPPINYNPPTFEHSAFKLPKNVQPKVFRPMNKYEILGPKAGKKCAYKNPEYYAYHRFSQVDLFMDALRFRMATRMEQLGPRKNQDLSEKYRKDFEEEESGDENPCEVKKIERTTKSFSYAKRKNPFEVKPKFLTDLQQSKNPSELEQNIVIPRPSIPTIQPRHEVIVNSDTKPSSEGSLKNLCEAKPTLVLVEPAIEPCERKPIDMFEPISEESYEMKRRKDECGDPAKKTPCSKSPNSACGNKDKKKDKKKINPCGKNKPKKSASDNTLQGSCEEKSLNLCEAEPQISYEMESKGEPVTPSPCVKPADDLTRGSKEQLM